MESPDLPELLQGESQGEEEESPATEWDMGAHLSVEQKSKLQELLDEFRDVFALDMSEMTTVRGEKFESHGKLFQLMIHAFRTMLGILKVPIMQNSGVHVAEHIRLPSTSPASQSGSWRW
jgi:hypothetical protein